MGTMGRFAVIATLFGSLLQGAAVPAELFVSTHGNDAWSGALAEPAADGTDGPLRTLAKAAARVQPGTTCTLRAGVYRELLRPAVSGTAAAPITFRSYPGETARLTGAEPLTDWRAEGAGVYSAPLPASLDHQNQLFADGAMLTEARWPDNTGTLLQPIRATAAAGTVNTLTDPNLPGENDAWKGAWLWCAGGAAWHCWARKVTAFDAETKTLTFEPAFKPSDQWYLPRKGNAYVLMGVRQALTAAGEWWVDPTQPRVYLIPPDGKDPNTLTIEAKQRPTVIDLSGRAQIRLLGLAFRAGGLVTDADSSDLRLQDLHGEYLGHSYVQDVSGAGSVAINGRRIDVIGCEFAYAAGSLLRVAGTDNRVVNCYVHEGNYAGTWSGVVALSGRRHVVSRNTFRHSGRDLISTGGLQESIVERNDLSHAGWLTHDLGMTYGHTNDFMNTEFRYNLVHDNMAESTSMGIYFDHLSMNAIVHHNLIWGTKLDGVRFNNPSFFCLSYHNTAWHTGSTGTFDHSRRNDLFGTRFCNNILNGRVTLPAHVVQAGNVVSEDPGFAAPERQDFSLKPGAAAIDAGVPLPGFNDGWNGEAPDAGALEAGTPLWAVGHDRAHPPPIPVWAPADVPYMNGIRNSCFEVGLEGWTPTGAASARTVPGNGWGNGWGQGQPEPTGTCKAELELGPGLDGVEQTVTGLLPDTCYTFSGWLKALAENETAALGVRDFGGAVPELSKTTGSTVWTRLTCEFRTGPTSTSALVFLRQTSAGPGCIRGDNLGLPRVPKGADWERPPAEPPARTATALAPPPPFAVKRVAQAPALDGRLAPDEWPATEMLLQQSPGRDALSSPPVRARLCHDGSTLYITVTVPVAAAAKLQRGAAWRTDDGVEICFVEARGAAPTFSHVVHGFCGGSAAAVTDGKATPAAAAKLGPAVRYAAIVNGQSWTGEWAIPLAAADIAVTPGLRLAFNLCAYRSEREEWVLWVGTQGAAWELANAGTIVLE
jgi:hypothetical protein